MPSNGKRKHVADDGPPACKQTSQKSISAFGTIGKLHDRQIDAKKRKTTHERARTPPPAAVAKVAMRSEEKRKRVQDSPDEDIIVVPSTGTSSRDREVQLKPSATPRNKRLKTLALPSPVGTPTRGAVALFDRLQIAANSSAIPCELRQPEVSYKTPPATPTDQKNELDLSYPSELEDFQDLYASFLTSLSLYYAHNSASSPVNVSDLLSRVTNHWRKRKVELQDLQRILSIGQRPDHSFLLQDCGKAGVCLTRAEPRGRALKRASSFVDEEALNRRFDDTLQKAWHTWQASTAKENRTAAAFLSTLPLVEITQHESVSQTATLFARGQQRLADLKASQAAAKAESNPPAAVQPSKQPAAAQSRSTALLTRLLAKQTLSASLPAGPSKAAVERGLALHRLEDVAKMLSLLVGTQERRSFSLAALTQQLQQSLRSPISKIEAERCLRLLAAEIAPGFVRLVQSGDVVGVVVARSANCGLEELRARVARAAGALDGSDA